jgi:hypothetical protein
MSYKQADRLSSIPTATGGIARLACERLREFGKDAGPILAQAGATAEQVYNDSIPLEVSKQIRILDLAAQELGDELLGFHLGCNFDLREIGLVYYVIASSERLADAIRNVERYTGIMNDGVRLHFRQDDRAAARTICSGDMRTKRLLVGLDILAASVQPLRTHFCNCSPTAKPGLLKWRSTLA